MFVLGVVCKGVTTTLVLCSIKGVTLGTTIKASENHVTRCETIADNSRNNIVLRRCNLAGLVTSQ